MGEVEVADLALFLRGTYPAKDLSVGAGSGDETLKGSPKGAVKGSSNGSPKGTPTGSPTCALTGSLSGSAKGSGDPTFEPEEPLHCDGVLHGAALQAFDQDERVIDHALAVAGLSPLIDQKQKWPIDGTVLEVSKWSVEGSEDYALRVWAGWPRTGVGKSPRALDPGQIHAYARAGRLFDLTPPVRGKSKLRLLLESGVRVGETIGLPNLPAEARENEVQAWEGVRQLVAVERLCGCHPPGDIVIVTPRFLSRWVGISFDVARDAIARLRRRGYLKLEHQIPLPGTPFKANGYSVLGDVRDSGPETDGRVAKRRPS